MISCHKSGIAQGGGVISQDIWNNVLAHVKEHVTDVEYQTWFAPIKGLGIQDGSFVLGVRNSFTQDFVKRQYQPLIEEALRTLGASNPQVSFQVLAASQDVLLQLTDTSKEEPFQKGEHPSDNTKDNTKSLNPKYTFENFLVGENNNLATAAALAIVESPGKAYNPLFIYGDVGLGKTHLMHAVGHAIAQHFPHKRIEYISTEAFTNELITAIREDKTTQFRNRYRSVDLLLVDDIQFLAGKERTQEEFFHTFNALYEGNKQIILSSDRPPKDIQTLENRLISRFEWGLITDIQSPKYETRIAILKMNAERNKVSVPEDVLEFIAKRVTSNIRELEGTLMRVTAFASLNSIPLSKSVAMKALSHVFSPEEVKIEMTDIVREVADHYNITPEIIRGNGRSREIVLPRQVSQYLIRELTTHSLSEIGQFFGRDHTTIMHGVNKVTTELERNPDLALALSTIRQTLKNEINE